MFATGNTKEKLKNAIIYFVQHDKTVKLTKLMKLLYYLDFYHYKESGYTVTGQEYSAWKHGPVPVDVWTEINKQEERGCDLKNVIRTFKVSESQDSFGYDLKLLGKQKFSDASFSKRELRILKMTSEIFHGVPAKLMVDATHMPGQPWEVTMKTKGQGATIEFELALMGNSEEDIARIKEDQQDRRQLQSIYGDVL